MNIGIYNVFEKKTLFLEEIDEKRTAKNQWGETGKDELARGIERMDYACRERNPQYIDETTGKAFDRGPWLVYADARPFDWDIVDHKPTPIEKASAIRATRNGLLAASDWTKSPSGNLPNAAEWKTYRQALLDITLQKTFPESVIWPEAPRA
ncbi:MAG: phage tail assembly chaperone [Spirochaetaceae bacterium]|nr:phage tail assembly chaperone [Spirochaetaceae bacterium]